MFYKFISIYEVYESNVERSTWQKLYDFEHHA